MFPKVVVQIFLIISFLIFGYNIIYIILTKKRNKTNIDNEEIQNKLNLIQLFAQIGIWVLNAVITIVCLNIFFFDAFSTLIPRINLGLGDEIVQIIGLSLVIGGNITLYLAYHELGIYWAYPIDGIKKPKKLVTSGIYSKIRHPIYLSFNLICIGFFMILLDWLILFLYLIGALGLYFQAIYEEKILIDYFKDDYIHYKLNVGRFFIRYKKIDQEEDDSTLIKHFQEKSNENKIDRKKKIFFILSSIMLIVFLIGGIIVNLPVIILISVYALLISNYTLLNNKKILNSLSIPLTFTYLFVMIYDFSQLNILFALFHIVTVIPCFIIIFRLNVSLIIMLGASFIYALWIFCIMNFLEFPYYQCIFGVCDTFIQFIMVLLIGVITSLISSKNRIKIITVQFLKKKLNSLVNKNV